MESRRSFLGCIAAIAAVAAIVPTASAEPTARTLQSMTDEELRAELARSGDGVTDCAPILQEMIDRSLPIRGDQFRGPMLLSGPVELRSDSVVEGLRLIVPW